MADLRDQPWFQFVQEIDELSVLPSARWAVPTLNGIRETVSRTKAVTEGQRRAVANIDATVQSRAQTRRRAGLYGTGRR